MSNNPPVVIWGAGGHAAVVAEALEASGRRVLGFLDDLGTPGEGSGGRATYASLGAVADLVPAPAIALGVGANAARRALADRAEAAGLELVTIVHPAAWVSPTAMLGAGTVVMAGAVVQARARLGRAVIVNTSASVDHDSELETGAHLGPGAHLSGWVRLGEDVWVGTGASVRDRIRVGDRTVVGVGAAVVRDLPPDTVAFGVPARPVNPASSP